MPYWNITYLSYTVSGCNSISLAILRKSEVDLRQALTVSPSSIDETNDLGQSALHLAVEWPGGMYLLLQAGADVDCQDFFNRSPLVYAIEMSLIEPIRLLALADCSLLGADVRAQLLLQSAVDIEVDAHPNREQVTAAERVVNLLVDMVVDRRQRLYDLAKSTLPVSDLDRLCHDSLLPDESASQLYSELQRHGTAVPLAFNPGDYQNTVFHQIRYSSRVAERLWKAGFRDINGRNPPGFTPLMSSMIAVRGQRFDDTIDSCLEYVAWLLEKGADLYAKQDLTLYYEFQEAVGSSGSLKLLSVTALHLGVDALGNALKPEFEPRPVDCLDNRLTDRSKKTLEQILKSNFSDACMCACSINGCGALTVLTKSYSRRWGGSVDLWATVKNFCDQSKVSELLRVMTFEELSMTHTCCYRKYISEIWITKDKAEIDEIRDEEAEDLQKLEELLEEFEAKRKELDIPFEDFITEYWQPRMKEVLEEGTLDEDALRKIGVKVD